MDCLDCKICNIPYDEDDRRPRNSRCGHEFCTVCLKALINNGTFMCPKCRMTSHVTGSDDFPVNFGLIDVIRAFKTQNISLTKKSEVCYEHFKDIKHRCLQCKTWLCDECLDDAKKHRGCVVNGTRFDIRRAEFALDIMKKEHTEDINSLISCFMERVSFFLSVIEGHKYIIQELTDMGDGVIEKAEKHKKEILDSAEKQCKEIMSVAKTQKVILLERAKKHGEEMEKICDLLELGKKQIINLTEWDDHLKSTCSPYRLMDNSDILVASKQQMKRYLESLEDYNLNPILKAVKENKEVYFKMVTGNENMYGKLSQHEDNVYVHALRNQTVSDFSVSMHFPQHHAMINEASLVFLELSLDDIVKGNLLLRLEKNSPNISENMVAIVTGKSGKSLADTELSYWGKTEIKTTNSLPFGHIPVTGDFRKTSSEKKFNVVGYYGEGYLRIMYFTLDIRSSGSTGQYEIGHIESGIDILQECHDKLLDCNDETNFCDCKRSPAPGKICLYPRKKLKISDCGLVIEKQE